MRPQDLIPTALLLGAFVMLAGLYGLLYGLGALRGGRVLLGAAWASYGLQCAVTLAILVATPLLWWWKVLIVASAAAYFRIPPVTWRYLQQLHEEHGA